MNVKKLLYGIFTTDIYININIHSLVFMTKIKSRNRVKHKNQDISIDSIYVININENV